MLIPVVQELLISVNCNKWTQLTAYGIPYKFFTDRRTVFTYKKKNSPSIDEDTYTQFAYACKQLGVELEASSAISVPVVISFQSRFPASAF